MSYLEFTTDDTIASGAVGGGYNVSGIATKFVVEGGMLADMVDYEEYTNLVQVSGDGTDPFYVNMSVNDTADPISVLVAGGFGVDTLPVTDFSAGSFYKFYVFADPTVPDLVIAIYDENDTELFRVDRQHYGALDIGANPSVSFGLVDDDDAVGTGPYARLDAVAFYDGHAPDETSEPSASDGGILGYWPINEGSGTTLGNEVSGGADLSIGGTEDTDWSWETGGIWDAETGAVNLTADSGTYSVTGSDADLLRDLLITGESGSYSVSGSAADLLRSLLLDGESGAYSISGQDADLLRDLLIDAESGSYTVVGSAADLLRSLLMSGDAGTYSVTGSAADLIVSTGVTLTADPGSYSVTGADADLLRDLQIEGEPGSYTVSGQPADLLRALLFSAEAGDYTVSGQQADLLRQLVMSGEAGSYSVSGAQATLLRDLLFDAEAGSYEVSGEDAQLVLAGAFEALNIAVSVDQPLDLSASIDQPLDLDTGVDQPLDMDVDVEPQE